MGTWEKIFKRRISFKVSALIVQAIQFFGKPTQPTQVAIENLCQDFKKFIKSAHYDSGCG